MELVEDVKGMREEEKVFSVGSFWENVKKGKLNK